MRILLTGGAGFIGRHVFRQIVADGHQVDVLDSLRPDVHTETPNDFDVIRADVRDADALDRVLPGADAVIHLAAKVGLGVDVNDLDDYVSTNSLGTAVLLRAMARSGVRRLVFASSMVVYGEGHYDCERHGSVAPGPRRVEDLERGQFEPPCPVCGQPLRPGLIDEEARLDPRNTYAATKVNGEHLAASWARETGGAVAAMRFHNVYGPGMPRDTPYAGVAAIFRSALDRGERPRVFEDGRQRRDFVHVRDIASAVSLALGNEQPFIAYNVGSGTVHTIGDLAAELARAYNAEPPVITGQYRLGDVRHITASSTRARTTLGWTPTYDLPTGIKGLLSN